MPSMFEQAFTSVNESLSFILDNQTGRPHKGGADSGGSDSGGGDCGSGGNGGCGNNSGCEASGDASRQKQQPTGGEQGHRFDPAKAQASLDVALTKEIYSNT